MLQLATQGEGLGSAYGPPIADVQWFEQELLRATELQSELLPLRHPGEAGIDLEARSVAARTIGGDFYDFFHYPGKAICAEAIGDVSGKGASAAIHAALVTGTLRSLASQELTPAEMLRALNGALLKRPLRGRFVSLLYATWDGRPPLPHCKCGSALSHLCS